MHSSVPAIAASALKVNNPFGRWRIGMVADSRPRRVVGQTNVENSLTQRREGAKSVKKIGAEFAEDEKETLGFTRHL
jgi:hypothetical protein